MYRRGLMRNALAFVLASMIFFCSGCNSHIQITTGLTKNEIFKISGNVEELSEMMLVLTNQKNKYENSLGSDIWDRTFDDVNLESEVKDTVKNQMVELYVTYLMAKEEDMELSEEEETLLAQAAEEYYNTLSEEEKNTLNVTQDTVYNLYEKMRLTEQYFDKKTSEDVPEISDEDARVIHMMYIFLKTGERNVRGEITDYDQETISAKNATANEVLAKVNAGSDFLLLIHEYSDSDEYEETVGRGVLDSAVDDAVFKLAAGEHSGLIQTEEGIYIVKCVNDYLENETLENKRVLEEKYKVDKFQEIYDPFIKKQTMEFNNSVWDKISVEDYSSCVSTGLYQVYHQYFPKE